MTSRHSTDNTVCDITCPMRSYLQTSKRSYHTTIVYDTVTCYAAAATSSQRQVSHRKFYTVTCSAAAAKSWQNLIHSALVSQETTHVRKTKKHRHMAPIEPSRNIFHRYTYAISWFMSVRHVARGPRTRIWGPVDNLMKLKKRCRAVGNAVVYLLRIVLEMEN